MSVTDSDTLPDAPYGDDDTVGSDDAADVFNVEDLNVYYGDVKAVQDVNLDVHEREITAFIGPSGCGKSTVLALPQPHERPHRDRPSRGVDQVPRR